MAARAARPFGAPVSGGHGSTTPRSHHHDHTHFIGQTPQPLVAFEGNRYSVGPAHAGRLVTVHARVGEPLLRILSPAGEIVATHRRAVAGAGQTIRSAEHANMLEHAVLQAFTTGHACRRKTNRPPGEDALAELARLKGIEPASAPVIDLARYAQLAEAAS